MQDPQDIPRDARILKIILGDTAHSQEIIPQLLEFMHRQIATTLEDCVLYNNEITPELMRFCLTPRENVSREFLADLAIKKNRIPLPLVGEKHGLRLPAERHLLTRQNFMVDPIKKKTKKKLLVPNPVVQNPLFAAPPPPVFVPDVVMTAAAVVDTKEDDDYDI